jgi:hypothetical protein
MDSQAIFSMISGAMSQFAAGPGMILGALLLSIGVLLVWMKL